MKTYDVDPLYEFGYELSCIKDDICLILAQGAVTKIPDYFWFVPSSSSGKYHPNFGLGMGGLARHVKGVFRVAEELFHNALLFPFTELEQDMIRVAILIHDGVKQGADSSAGHTVHEHPILPREHLKPNCVQLLEGKQEPKVYTPDEAYVLKLWGAICDLIDTHHGQWNIDHKGNSDLVLPLPETPMQRFVHLCDYLGSRRGIEIDVSERRAQKDYYRSEPKNDAWREEMASQSQVDYIMGLYQDCKKALITVPPGLSSINIMEGNKIILPKGRASDVITELKTLLGR